MRPGPQQRRPERKKRPRGEKEGAALNPDYLTFNLPEKGIREKKKRRGERERAVTPGRNPSTSSNVKDLLEEEKWEKLGGKEKGREGSSQSFPSSTLFPSSADLSRKKE